LPFYEAHDLPVLRILADHGTVYCGRAETHNYQLFLQPSLHLALYATYLPMIDPYHGELFNIWLKEVCREVTLIY
jgi:hypothetical protein